MSRTPSQTPITPRERELTAALLAISIQAQNATSAVEDGSACFVLLAETMRQIAEHSADVLAVKPSLPKEEQ